MSFRDERQQSKRTTNNVVDLGMNNQRTTTSKKRNAFAESSSSSSMNNHHVVVDIPSSSDESTDSDTIDKMRSLVENAITQIRRDSKYFEECEKKLGTDKDTKQLRVDLKKRISASSNTIKETHKALKSISPPKNPVAKGQFDKLKRDLNECFASFNQLQRIERMEKEIVLKEKANVDKLKLEKQQEVDVEEQMRREEAERIKLLQYQQKKQDFAVLENKIAHNERIIQEREEDIADIEQDIHEIAQIFKEMNIIVKQQQVGFDMIEENVEKAGYHVKEGNTNLETANKYDKRSRNLACIILLIVLGLAVVAAIVLVIILKSVHVF